MSDFRDIFLGVLPKRLFQRGLIALALLMTFKTFQFFPGMLYVQEMWFVLCFLALVVVYPVWKISKGLRFSSLEVYILTLIVVDVLLPAWGARREFGQPMAFGVLASRGATLMVSSLLLVNALRYRLVRLADIQGALLLCAWGTSVLYATMKLTLHPANFSSYGVGFVVGEGAEDSFNLNPLFILYATIYYVLLGLRTRSRKYYVLAAILFAGTVVPVVERSATISIAATLLFFLYRWRPFGQFLLTLGKVCCAAAIVLGLAYAANPAYLSIQSARFSDAFTVAFTGSEVDDPSAGARLFEIVTAMPYIQKHPLLGNGNISHQWGGGTEGVMSQYFYAGDIGVLGAIFTVGVLGTLVFAYQFRFALRAARSFPDGMHSPLSDAAAGFLLYCAVTSVTTAFFVSNPEVILFFVAILVGLASEGISERRRSIQRAPAIHAPSLDPGHSSSSWAV